MWQYTKQQQQQQQQVYWYHTEKREITNRSVRLISGNTGRCTLVHRHMPHSFCKNSYSIESNLFGLVHIFFFSLPDPDKGSTEPGAPSSSNLKAEQDEAGLEGKKPVSNKR